MDNHALNLPPLAPPDAPDAPQPAWKGILTILLTGLLGAAVGYFGVRWLGRPAGDLDLTGLQRLLLLPAVLLVVFAAITLHELGHLAGGRLGGFRPALLIVGPLRLTASGRGLQLGWNRSLGLMGGLAMALPTSGANLRRGMLLLVAGGPATSLATGLGLLLVRLWVPAGSVAPLIDLLLLFGGVTSLLIGLVTLLPLTSGGFQSDGRRLLGLLRRDPEVEAGARLLLLTGAAMAGVRPRSWDPALLAQLPATDDASGIAAGAAALRYLWALDQGDLAAARRHLQRMLDLNYLLPAAARPEALYEAAFFEAWYRRDEAAARRFLPGGGEDGLTEPATRLKAQLALALLRADWPAARQLAAKTEGALRRSTMPGTATLLAEQLATMAERIPAAEHHSSATESL